MKEFYSGEEERRMEEERQWRERMAEETARLATAASAAGMPAGEAAKNIQEAMAAAEGPTPAERAKADFLNIYENIHRSGADELLKWLERSTDFFTAPASTKHHGAHPGGLVIHSVNVWCRLRAIACRDILEDGPAALAPETEETVAILGLLHDLAKVNCYHPMDPFKAVLDNIRERYIFRDTLPLGHGEKSLFLISRFIPLKDAEALAIRWHMGAYDASTPGARCLDAAMRLTPWVWRLQEADMCAANIDEREAQE